LAAISTKCICNLETGSTEITDGVSAFLRSFAARQRTWGEVHGCLTIGENLELYERIDTTIEEKLEALAEAAKRGLHISPTELNNQLHRAAVTIIHSKKVS
jgi:hypothetical protein